MRVLGSCADRPMRFWSRSRSSTAPSESIPASNNGASTSTGTVAAVSARCSTVSMSTIAVLPALFVFPMEWKSASAGVTR
eukprot:scaffold2790_cov122-Isochrysis_galbana.AAC.4